MIKPAANECFKCEDEDVGGMAGCSECEKNNGVFECRKCDKKGYGKILYINNLNYYIYK